jgi:hypothetical protein
MPSLGNRYPLEPAFARQVGVRSMRIMWVISNGEFSENLTGESNGIATLAPTSPRRLQDRPLADPGKIVALALVHHCGTGNGRRNSGKCSSNCNELLVSQSHDGCPIEAAQLIQRHSNRIGCRGDGGCRVAVGAPDRL